MSSQGFAGDLTLAEDAPPLRAALGGPRTRAGAGRPRAAAGVAGEPAGAAGAGVAMAYVHGHGAVAADLAADSDGDVAAIAEHAIGDAHGIAIAGNAVALFGDDRHAPDAVIARHGDAGAGAERERRGDERRGAKAHAVS